MDGDRIEEATLAISPSSKEKLFLYDVVANGGNDLITLFVTLELAVLAATFNSKAISLLVGNDHDSKGVQGIGIETALSFVKSFNEDEVLERLCGLRTGNMPSMAYEGNSVQNLDENTTKIKLSHCSLCGHPESKRSHFKDSYEICNSNKNEDVGEIRWTINMSPDDVSRLQLELFPLIQEIITEWHIMHLFTTTPSESPAMEDFSSQLSLLQIDNSIDRRSWNEKLGKSDFTLAFIMLLDHQSSFKDQNRVDSKHLPNPTSFIAPSETNHERIDALRTAHMRQKRSDSKPVTENQLRGPNEGHKKKNGRFEAKLQVFGLIRNMQLEGD
ncbi:hypothetical protein L1887_18021 [Cichorium endivia]|nr:hypothetical protein L1887_18021 [Cichorium endivia]